MAVAEVVVVAEVEAEVEAGAEVGVEAVAELAWVAVAVFQELELVVSVEWAVVDIGVVVAFEEFGAFEDKFLLQFHHLDIVLQAFLLLDISLVFLLVGDIELLGVLVGILVGILAEILVGIDSLGSVLEHPIVSGQELPIASMLELSIVLVPIVEGFPMVELLV